MIRRRWIVTGVLVAAGLLLTLVRPWGMRFSGVLLLCAAGALLLSAALKCWAARSGKGRWCRRIWRVGLALLLALLLGIEAVVLCQGRRGPSETPAGAIIVLGAGVNGRRPSLSLQTRLDAALTYLEGHPDVPAVLTGGRGYGEEITEAHCMYDYLTARGIDRRRLLLEERAANTAENFAFSRQLLEERGVDAANTAVAVVTNDFHIARARLIARKQGYGPVTGVPARLPWLHLEVNYYLREAFAIVKTVLFD